MVTDAVKQSSPLGPRPAVLTIGMGALGVLYSFILSRAGVDVTCVARSNYAHLAAEGNGIEVDSAMFGHIPSWKPTRAFRSQEQAADRVYDYVLVTTKCTPDVTPLSSLIRNALRPPAAGQKGPVIVLIQNGIGIEEEVYQSLVVPGLASQIISCTAWVGSNLLDGGRKIEHGQMERLDMGLYPALSKDQYPELAPERTAFHEFVRLYRAGGGTANPVLDIQPLRWKKVLWNAAWGGLCCAARKPVLSLLQDDCLDGTASSVRGVMEEIVAIARAEGISEDVYPSASIDTAVNVTLQSSPRWQREAVARGELPNNGLKPSFKPSILIDLENERPMEFVPILDSLYTRARKHDVSTPRLDFICAALRPIQQTLVARANGSITAAPPAQGN